MPVVSSFEGANQTLNSSIFFTLAVVTRLAQMLYVQLGFTGMTLFMDCEVVPLAHGMCILLGVSKRVHQEPTTM